MKTPRTALCGALVFAFVFACRAEGERQGDSHPGVSDSAPGTVVPARASAPSSETDPVEPAERHLHLPGPTLAHWKPIYSAHSKKLPPKKFTRVAVVTGDEVLLYAKPGSKTALGYARTGSRLPAFPVSPKASCDGGQWYEVSGNAYVCADSDVKIEPRGFHGKALSAHDRGLMPKLTRPNPYRFVKMKDGAPLLAHVPTPSQAKALASGKPPSGLVSEELDGTYLLALLWSDGTKDGYDETLHGRFIRESDIAKPFPNWPMHGVHLDDSHQLPIAFAYHASELYCLDGEVPTPCGSLDKHARFPAGNIVKKFGKSWVLLRDDVAALRDDVRIADQAPRPDGVGPDDKWVDIDLSQQTLVAYEGDTPVLATLVSTGHPGHDTPDGLFHVYSRYLTKTMKGHDKDGPYSVQEVPWTMYFHAAYAVHGAYWHDVFGHTRSHGCVNVPPADARWLFYWSGPKLPRGWSGMFDIHGMYVSITGKTPTPQGENQTDA